MSKDETERNERSDKSKHAPLFYSSPDPLPPALSYPPASNGPPPPGRGMSEQGDRFAETTCGHIRQPEYPE